MNHVKFLSIIVVSMLLITCSAGIISAKNDKVTDTLKLEEKYKLHLEEVSVDGDKIWLQLIQKNNVVDDLIVSEGEHFEMYDDEDLIVVGNCTTIAVGLQSYLIKLTDLKQYDENGNMIFSQEIVLLETKKVKNKHS
ncbi:MAG TPA: hypothetical protein HA304_01535 [Methanosarcinales archaeon]|nr:hypothetical protein [Methanosarcinales archaeon]